MVYEPLSFLNVNVGDSTYLYIYLILLVAGLVIAMLCSFISMGRHLKV